MIKNTLIIALIVVIIYLYYQQRKNNLAHFTGSVSPQKIAEVKKVNKIFADFCKNEIGGQDINEIRTKLNGRTLTEILEENEDYETNTDALTRQKEEKKDLETKYKNKTKLLDEEQCENNKLETQITSLETQITELKTEIKQDQQAYHDQLRQINLLFDPQAKNYSEIDFTAKTEEIGDKFTRKSIEEELDKLRGIPSSTVSNQNEVLSNFFQNLLSKKPNLENQVQQTVNPHLNKVKETAYKPVDYYHQQEPFYRVTIVKEIEGQPAKEFNFRDNAIKILGADCWLCKYRGMFALAGVSLLIWINVIMSKYILDKTIDIQPLLNMKNLLQRILTGAEDEMDEIEGMAAVQAFEVSYELA
ncbi:2346_t:CDS:2 [Funneliformis geosporum]|nr:2346_t:CDS:2 [Funneliformis geosporum]